jgi:hypothetical protein
MKASGKTFIAVFLSLLFLFPLFAETLHQYAHASDVHCDDHSSFHFHKEEHHCAVCAFTLSVTDGKIISDESTFTVLVTGILFKILFFSELQNSVTLLFQRGPPVMY